MKFEARCKIRQVHAGLTDPDKQLLDYHFAYNVLVDRSGYYIFSGAK